MSEDNNNKEDKQFSFIQEKITSKKKSKFKRMLFSVLWTMVLGCIFGCVGAVVFCISEPTISRFLGKQQVKKTVEFSVESSGEESSNKSDSLSPAPTVTKTPKENDNTVEEQKNIVGNDNNIAAGATDKENNDTKQEQVKLSPINVKENPLAFLEMYEELKSISNKVNNSLVTVTSISSGVDIFDNEYEEASSTSGLIVANNEAELLILVSLNRIEDAKEIKVTFSDYLQVDASLQEYDSDLNLAVISVKLEDIPKSKMTNLTPAILGESYAISVGTPIMALGNPNGYVGSMEIGIITSSGSSSYITDDEIDLFNTDVAYNENGDGVIVNMKGEVIGIITNELKGELNQNINTVIGISRIKRTIECLVNNTDRVYFGIKAADMTEAALKKAEIANGICITEVEVNSPALEAGLQSGDIILSINDTPVMSVNSFQSIISIFKPKTSVNITIRRNAKGKYTNKNVEVVLTKKKS